nr:LPD38 domain-containing protein [uncultured Phascolarctobacterium sp.]
MANPLLTDEQNRRLANQNSTYNQIMQGFAPVQQPQEDSWLGGLSRGAKAGFGGVGAGLLHAGQAAFGTDGSMAAGFDAMAENNAQRRDWDLADTFSLDYLTSPDGLAYGIGQIAGSMALPALFGAGVAAAVPSGGTSLLGTGALIGAAGAAPMAISEGGNTYAQGLQQGMTEDEAKKAGLTDAAIKLPFYMLSEGLSGKVAQGLISKGLLNAEGKSLGRRAAESGAKILGNAGNEAYEEATENRSSAYALGDQRISGFGNIFNPFDWNDEDKAQAVGVFTPTLALGTLTGGAGHLRSRFNKKNADISEEIASEDGGTIEDTQTENNFWENKEAAKHSIQQAYADGLISKDDARVMLMKLNDEELGEADKKRLKEREKQVAAAIESRRIQGYNDELDNYANNRETDKEAFINAIAGQESGGSYNAENSDTGAYGKYQIVPENWPAWAEEAGIGADAPRTPENQEIVARFKLGQYYDKYGARGAAIAWYGGEGALNYSDEALNRKQGDNGEYPSINEYADEVLGRMGNVADNVRIDDTEENYFDESNYTDDTILGALRPARGFDVSHLVDEEAQDTRELFGEKQDENIGKQNLGNDFFSNIKVEQDKRAKAIKDIARAVSQPNTFDELRNSIPSNYLEQMQKARAVVPINNNAVGRPIPSQTETALTLQNGRAKGLTDEEQAIINRYQGNPDAFNRKFKESVKSVQAAVQRGDITQDVGRAYLNNLANMYDTVIGPIQNNGVIMQGQDAPIRKLVNKMRAKRKQGEVGTEPSLLQENGRVKKNAPADMLVKTAKGWDKAEAEYKARAEEKAEKHTRQQTLADIINARAAQKWDEAENTNASTVEKGIDIALPKGVTVEAKSVENQKTGQKEIELKFSGEKISDEFKKKLRAHGFNWKIGRKAWVAEENIVTKAVAEKLTQKNIGEVKNGKEETERIDKTEEQRGAEGNAGETRNSEAEQAEAEHVPESNQDEVNKKTVSVEENIANGEKAIEKVISEHTDAIDAMKRDDVGGISFYYGTPGTGKKFKKGYGIAHMIAKRNSEGLDGEAFVKRLPEVIAKGEIVERQTAPNGDRVLVKYGDITTVLSLYKDGNRQTWVVTGWDDSVFENKKETTSSDAAAVYDANSATSEGATRSRSNTDEVASVTKSVAQPEQNVKKINLPKGTTVDVSIVGDNSNIIQVKFNGEQGKGTGGILGRAGYKWKSDKQLWQARKTDKAMDVAEQLGYTEEAKPQERDYELERTARQQRLQESNERATQSLIAQNKDESVPGKRYTVRNKFFSVNILDGIIRVKDARKINPQDNQYNFSLSVEEYQRAAQNGNRLAGISKLLKAKIREGLENWIEESPNERTKEVRKQQNDEATLAQATDQHFEVAYPLIESALQKAGIEALDHQTLFERAKKAKPSADTFSKNPDSLFNTNALTGAPKQVTDIIQKMPKAEQSKTTKKQTSTDSTKDVISKELLKSKSLEASARNNTYNDFKIAYFDAVDDYLVDNIDNNPTYAELLKDARFAEKNMEGAAKEAYDFFRRSMEKTTEPKESKVITSDNVADVVESKQGNTEGGKNNANNPERLQSVPEGGTAETVQGLNGKQDLGGVRGQEISGSNGLLSRNNGATDAGQSSNARGLHGESTPQQYVSDTSERTDKRNDVPQGLTPAQQADAKAEETPGHNFTIKSSSDVADNGKKKKYQGNIAAIKLLKKLESEGRMATPAEQKVLAKYIGWGPVQEVFSPKKYPEWESEYNELKELLTPQEWSAARESVLTAFFTPPAVIDSVYKVVQHLGFKGGKVLDPSMGHGNYFGAMPTRLRKNCMLRGVELDPITGAMAKQLYQDASVEVTGFENAYLDNNSYDLVISNVPFNTNVHPIDRDFKTQNFNLHNYFFAKAVQKARPGGLIVFITSENTMKSDSAALRKYLEGKADFIGAMKLPDTTFKSYSGTAVTSDLIILQKRDESGKPNKYAQEWLDSSYKRIFDKKGTYIAYGDINEYYAKHPGMVIGEWGTGNYSSLIVKGGDLNVADEIAKRAENLPKNIYKPLKGRQENSDTQTSTVDYLKSSMLQQGSLITDENGIPVVKSGNKVIPFGDKSKRTYKKDLQCANDYIRVRDVAKTLLDKQLDPNVSDEELSKHREELNTVYDNFVANNGALNAKGKLLSGDPDYGLICAIENYSYDKTSKKGTATKTAIFTTRTVNAIKPATSAATVNDALALSLSNKGILDIEYMQELLPGKPTEKEIVKSLGDKVFKDPATDSYVMADEYLSGNVREKLEQAKLAVQTNRDYAKNVKALEKVIPQDWTEKDIKASLGSAWIPAQDVEQFAHELMGSKNGTVTFIPSTGTWVVDMKGSDYGVKGTQQYGTSRRAFGDILSAALNQKTIEIKTQGTPDVKESDLANAMVKKVQEEFEKWIWADESRKKRLLHFYNNNFNATVLRNYDGSMLNLPGYSALAPKLRGHQKDAIWRIIQNGTCLLAHCVGAGKTWTMQAAAMEMKRLGLISKPMFTVPNHMVEQFTNEFRQIYPNAKLLVLTAENLPEIGGGTSKNPAVVKLNKAKRKSTLAKIATEDWDGIIISHELFKRIPMSAKAYEEYYQQQADEIEQALSESADSDENYRTTKELEKKLASAKDKMKKAMNEVGKDLDTPFDKLGIDQIFVDEADLFKNLAFTTNMGRVAGISNSNSQRSQDMYIKTQYLLNTHNGRGVVFATGTPISNSIAEMFTMLRYLNPQALKNAGVSFFDNFISTFSQKESTVEPKPDGNGYRIVQKFTNFYNASGMKRMFREVADVKTQAEINVKIPKLKNGERTVTELDITAPLKQYITTTIKDRADSIRNNEVDPSEDNMLKLTSDLRKASLDLRLIDGYQSLPTEIAAPKILAVADNAYNKYVESNDVKGTQLIFCDLSTPKGKSDNELAEGAEEEVLTESEQAANNSVYTNIAKELIRKGIPKNEIAYIHDAKTNEQKEELFAKVRSGEIRILIGSTSKMGAGTNCQRLIVAEHHVDCPWRPRDIEQREGRALRQGNLNDEVEIFTYVTKDSFDTNMWEKVKTKSQMIGQAMNSDLTINEIEDIGADTLSYAEIQGLASGDPFVPRRIAVSAELNSLRNQYREYEDNRKTNERTIRDSSSYILALEKEVETAKKDAEKLRNVIGENFSIVIAGKTFTKFAEAEKVLEGINQKVGSASVIKGNLAGLDFKLYYMPKGTEYRPSYKNSIEWNRTASLGGYVAEFASSDPNACYISLGKLRAMVNMVTNGIPSVAKIAEEEIRKNKAAIKEATEALNLPFDKEAEYKKLLEEEKVIAKHFDAIEKAANVGDNYRFNRVFSTKDGKEYRSLGNTKIEDAGGNSVVMLESEDTETQETVWISSDEIENTVSPSNTQYSVSSEAVQRAKEEVEAEIRAAFPNGKVEYVNGVPTITMPNGSKFQYSIRENIVVNAKEQRKADAAHGTSGARVQGFWKKFTGNGVQRMLAVSQNSERGTAFHEAMHAAIDLVLTEKEKNALYNYYEKKAKEQKRDVDEVIADAYRDWVLARQRKSGTMFGKLWRKVKDFCTRIKALFDKGAEVERIMQDIESGRVYERGTNNHSVAKAKVNASVENIYSDAESINPNEEYIQGINDTDAGKVNTLAKSFEDKGYVGRPVLLVENGNEGYIALTGSHRIEAAKQADVDLKAIVLENNEDTAQLIDARDDDERENIAKQLYEEGAISKSAYDIIREENANNNTHYSVAPAKHKIANAFTNTERKGVVDSAKDFFKEHRKSLYQDWFDKNNPLKGFDALTKATGGLSVYDQVQSLPATTAGMLKALTEGTAQHVKMANQHLKNVKMKYNVTLAMALEKIDKKQMDKAYPKYLAENGFDNWVNALGAYLGAERCLEMAQLARAEGKTYKFPKGLTEQECQEFVKKAPQQFKAAADIFYKVNDNVISIMEDAQVFSHDLAKTLRTKYRKYCPLLRDFSDTAAADSFIGGLTEGGRGIGNVSIPLKRINIEGSERGVLNPLETILKSYAVMLNRAERNKVALMAVENSKTADLHELIQEVPGTTADPKNCVFTVLINGKKKAYKTTQDLYGPIVGYNLPAANLAFGVARTAARMLRTGATMSPSFILRNVLRDTVFAGVSSKNGFIPIVDTIRGAIALAKDPAMRAEFEAAGVTEYNFYSSQKARIKSLDAMAGETPASAWEIMKAVFSRLEATSDFFESSTRMGEYMKARQKGLSMEEAARAAREVTLDFSRSGRIGEQVNQVVPFFNACLQGGDKMVRLFRETPWGTAMKVTAYIILPSLFLLAMNWNEDWYKDLDPDIKNNYWCVGRNIRIPKPQEAGVLFGSGIEALFQQAAGKDKDAVSNFLEAFCSNMIPSVLPTLILPLIEWSANYSFYKGRPLVSNKYSRLPDELQYNDYTSELSKGIGSAFKVSPMKFDNLVRGYTGTMGALLWSMAGEPFAKANNLPAKHFSELPFVRDFNVTDANLSRPMNEFYGILDKANRQHAGYGVKGKPEAAVKGIRSAGSMISKIRKDIDKITHSNLTPERKRELIDKRKEKMNQIAKQANARYGKYFD